VGACSHGLVDERWAPKRYHHYLLMMRILL
jgi:hypothetical protein